MPYAISYKRFSAPRQAWGDSFRRQTDLAIEYCQRHNLRLIDTYLDAGLSAYNGQNLSDGAALKMLLDGAREGKFAPGTHLIVESLDRLSRSEISMAVRLFLDILEMGLVIVTLIDGEQVFTKQRVDNDMTALIIPIVILSRANNESRNRRARIAQARQNTLKRAREFKLPITSKCPAWLVVTGRRNARRFVVDETRAEIVRQVFTLATGEMGQNRLAQLLNERNIPTITGRPTWRTPMIAHLLRDRAVLGIYHPKHRVYEDGVVRRVLDPEGPIDNYYPPIVSQELWDAAWTARMGRQPKGRLRHERHFSNLVPRLGRCAICGDLLSLSSAGRSRVPYLRCTGSKHTACSNRAGFPYRKLEPVLLSLDILTEAVARLVAEWLADEEIARRVVKLEARITRAKNSLETLVASVSSKRDYRLRATNTRIERLHAEVERQHRELEETKQETNWGKLSDQGKFLPRFRIAKSSLGTLDVKELRLARSVLAAELRRLVKGVVLDTDRVVTIHMKSDIIGYSVVYEVRPEGLQGAHVKITNGSTGFIEAALLANVIKLRDPSQDETIAVGDLIKGIQILKLPNGNWKAVIPDPFQIAEIVLRAERALASPSYGIQSP